MPVHVIMGPPCAGKTTFARAQLGEVIDLDDIEESLGGKRYAEHSSVREQALQIRAERIDAAFEAESDTWLIHTSPSPTKVAEYLARGATVQLLDPGESTCLDRARDRPPHTAAVIRDWYQTNPLIEAGFFMPQAGKTSDSQEETMSEEHAQQGATQPTAEQTGQQATPKAEPKMFDEAYVKELRAEAAANRVKLKEYEDRDKSALEKAIERAEAAEKAIADREAADKQRQADEQAALALDELRAEVAQAKGIADASILAGTSREELEAHADKLKPLINPHPVNPDTGKTPDKEPSEVQSFVAELFGGGNN
ncbi:hypothetical protein D3229_09985 [Leucobacter aridicollis]|nr:hypothetical protein [Leucobacter aridicollis]